MVAEAVVVTALALGAVRVIGYVPEDDCYVG